jgi:hypothetical protein
MVSLVISLLIGAIIILLASSNAHLVEVWVGPFRMVAPMFVTMGVAYFIGFGTAVLAVLVKAIGKNAKNHKKQQGRGIALRP